MNFKELLRIYRERRRYNKAMLAKKIGVHPSYCGNIELGKRPVPTAEITEKIITALDLKPTEAFEFAKIAFTEKAESFEGTKGYMALLETLSRKSGNARAYEFVSKEEASAQIKKIIGTYHAELNPEVLEFTQEINMLPWPDRKEAIEACRPIIKLIKARLGK